MLLQWSNPPERMAAQSPASFTAGAALAANRFPTNVLFAGKPAPARVVQHGSSPHFSPIELNKAVFHGITLVRASSYSQRRTIAKVLLYFIFHWTST
jgi:hypothetical protein